MKVWIILGCLNFQGCGIEDCFDTEKKAKKRLKELRAKLDTAMVDSYRIEEWEIK